MMTNRKNNETRSREIIKYSISGIVMNMVLAVLKLVTGSLTRAHAVMLDGINSLSDSISSMISILSISLSNKGGDRTHPLGYGRIEYIGSMAVTLIVMYIGIGMLINSVKMIIHPSSPPDYDLSVIVVMTVSLLCKIGYGIVTRKQGKELCSIAMIMSGTDSLGDALASAAILAAIAMYEIFGIDIEHYLCLVIAAMILKTGIEMLLKCVNSILGTRIDPEVRKSILSTVIAMPEVLGISNIVLHNYGQNHYVGSVDIEVEESMPASEISKLSRRIIRAAEEIGVSLTSVGISAANTSDPDDITMWDQIIELAAKHPGIRRIHSFTCDKAEGVVSFYLVPDYSCRDREQDITVFIRELTEMYPEITPDIYWGIDM